MKSSILGLSALLLLAGGCHPPCSSAEPIGRTPVTKKFTWYGDYDIILRYPEKGYKTLKTHEPINAPWYEVPPIDLFSHIVPWTIRDKRYLHYKLEKLPPGSEAEDEKLIDRARDLQKRSKVGT